MIIQAEGQIGIGCHPARGGFMALEGGADLADKRLDMAARRWGLPSAQESCDDGGHLLGNVVISKNFLRTCKIMVMI